MRMRLVIPGAFGLVLLAGCSSGPTATIGTGAPVATATQSSSNTTTTTAVASSSSSTSAPAVSSSSAKTFLDALQSRSSPDKMRRGLSSAAPASPAFVYLTHFANQVEADVDGGNGRRDGRVIASGGDSYKVCNDLYDDKACADVAGFKVDASGKVVDFTVNGEAIAPRLTTGNGQAVSAGDAKFTFLSAYSSVTSPGLTIVIKVETGKSLLNINTYSASYRGPDGKQRKANEAGGPHTVDANSNALIYVGVPEVKPGGKVTLEGCVEKGCAAQFKAVLQVG